MVGALALARPEIGVAVLLLLAPLLKLTIGPASLTLLVYGLSFALLAYALLTSRAFGQAAPRSLTIGVVVFVVAAMLSAAGGINPGGSTGRIVFLLSVAAIYFSVLTICRTPRQLVLVAMGALGGLFLAAVHGLAQSFLGLASSFTFVSGGDVVERVQGSFGHPNEYGGFLAVLIPLALGIAASRSFSARARSFAGTALLLAVPALFYSYARGPVLALTAGLMIWVAVLRPKLALPVAAVIAVGAILVAPPALKERFSESTGGDVTLRSDIWRGALTIYSDHPVLGVGPNNFAEAYSALPTELPGAAQRRLLHTSQILVPPYAENLYLNILAEQGIVGLTALLVFLVGALLTVYRGARVRDPRGRAVCFGAGAGLLVRACHGVVQVTLFTEIAPPLFALLALAGRFVTLDWEAERAAEL